MKAQLTHCYMPAVLLWVTWTALLTVQFMVGFSSISLITRQLAFSDNAGQPKALIAQPERRGSWRRSGSTHLRASAAVPRPWADPAVARPRAMGSLKRNRSNNACTKLAPRTPVRHTPAAVMEAGACSWAAMGSASATVTLLGTSARASSA